eukprot:TRINITY_DN35973_c0_g1_i1.p1 TRINITY_DN35973_c0_g1~~TRINITY_DN35973_c0_g1_i1.p1  ORF type:complete len:406 (+),score=38.88 TRINITY_DN35973_c0_g1_i1:101-1318(+)
MSTWKAIMLVPLAVIAEKTMESSSPSQTVSLMQQFGPKGDVAQVQLSLDAQSFPRRHQRPAAGWAKYFWSWTNLLFERTSQCLSLNARVSKLANHSMELILESPSYRWWMEAPERSTPKVPKLAVLFMIEDRIHNMHIWEAWMQRASNDGLRFKIHVHAYGMNQSLPEVQKKVEAWPELFRQGLLKKRQKSEWGNIWGVQRALLVEALKDKHVSHVVWMDQTSIPVAPLRLIYHELNLDPSSRFCADWGIRSEMPRAETWSIMQRADAEVIIANHGRYGKMIRDWRLYDEQYFFWPLHVRNLQRTRSGRPSTLQSGMEKGCYHFTDWLRGNPCNTHVTWAHKTSLCDCPTLKRSLLSEYPDVRHPSSFMHIDRRAYEELWNSSFWFARKFDDYSLDASQIEIAAS